MKAEVMIIGAGVLGISLAYHLGTLGIPAMVIERESTPAVHASGKNAGMVRQLYRHSQLTDWANRSIKMWPEEVRSQTFKRTGSIIIGRNLPNHHHHLFSEETIQTNFNSQTIELPAVRTKSDGLLDSGSYVNLLAQLARPNTEFIFNCKITFLDFNGKHWIARSEDGRTFSAKWIVNASGAWFNTFSESEFSCLPKIKIQLFARHLFLVTGWPENFMPIAKCGFYWDEHHQWYMRVWDNTSRLVSICDKLPVTPESLIDSDSIKEELALKLLNCFPQLSQKLHLKVSWNCFRTYAEDLLPIWGEDAYWPRLFWLGAFGGFGMSTSFAACYDAAQYITGNNSATYVDFSPERVKDKNHTTPWARQFNE